ncbi:MAG: hypothetical protein RL654_3024 [Pseudomonadota bacterium]
MFNPHGGPRSFGEAALFCAALLLALPGWCSSAHAAVSLSDLEREVLAQINQIRVRHGLSVLEPDPRLQQAATRHSTDMAVSRCFQHDDCDGGGWSERIHVHYPRAQRIAENIAAGQASAGTVVEGWMRSEVHRANILQPEWQGTGISLVSLPGSPYGHYWTQTFGALPAPVPEPAPAMPERMSRSSSR